MASVISNTTATDEIPTLSPTLADVMTTAIQSAITASLSKTSAATSAGIASAAQISVAGSSSAATASAVLANARAVAAGVSETNASASASSATGSAAAASASALAASGSATAANGSAVAAAASAVLAESYVIALGSGPVASVNGQTVIVVLTAADVGALAVSSNLSDLVSVATARVNLKVDQITPKGDVNYTVLTTDRAVVTSATFTAAHTWILPAASAVNPGQSLVILDTFGTFGGLYALTIAAAGADTINGQGTLILGHAYAGIILVSDGVSNWSFAVQSITTGGTGAQTAADARTNLGLGTSATHALADFLQPTNNLTDVTNATTARGSLSAAASGANSDITSLASLTTPLSVAQGGTGSTSAPTAINGLTITSTSATFNLTTGKTLAVKNSLTLQGTDTTTFTFPSASSNVLTTGNSDTISIGYKVAPYAYSTGNITINPALGNYSYITNNGAFSITAPTNDCAVDLLVTNGASAGAVTFSGFTVGASTGSALDTTNGHNFIVSFRRINSVSTYSIYALQ